MALPTQTIQALAVSPGIAIGRTMRVTGQTRYREPEPHRITEDEIPAELSRLSAALALTRTQLVELRQEVRNKLKAQEAEIFDAHIMIVDDRTMIAEAEKGIREKHYVAEYALYLASEHFANVFAGMILRKVERYIAAPEIAFLGGHGVIQQIAVVDNVAVTEHPRCE